MAKYLYELRSIYRDEGNTWPRRIEAAAQVLLHQSPDDLVIDATEFLNQVAQNADNAASDRIDAIKALAKREVPTTREREQTSVEEETNREQWRRFFSGLRRVRLIEDGLWPAPPGWDDDLESDDFVAPQESFKDVWLKAADLAAQRWRKRCGN